MTQAPSQNPARQSYSPFNEIANLTTACRNPRGNSVRYLTVGGQHGHAEIDDYSEFRLASGDMSSWVSVFEVKHKNDGNHIMPSQKSRDACARIQKKYGGRKSKP